MDRLMTDRKELIEQAQRTYERLTERLDTALAHRQKFLLRGRRTTAYAALQGHIQRLEVLQDSVRKRLQRRQASQKFP
jgi:hypothetical protein